MFISSLYTVSYSPGRCFILILKQLPLVSIQWLPSLSQFQCLNSSSLYKYGRYGIGLAPLVCRLFIDVMNTLATKAVVQAVSNLELKTMQDSGVCMGVWRGTRCLSALCRVDATFAHLHTCTFTHKCTAAFRQNHL